MNHNLKFGLKILGFICTLGAFMVFLDFLIVSPIGTILFVFVAIAIAYMLDMWFGCFGLID